MSPLIQKIRQIFIRLVKGKNVVFEELINHYKKRYKNERQTLAVCGLDEPYKFLNCQQFQQKFERIE